MEVVMTSNNHPAASVVLQFGKFSGTKRPTLSSAQQAQVAKVQEFLRLYGGGQTGFTPEDAALATPLPDVTDDEQLLVVYLPDGQDGTPGFFRTLDTWFNFAGQDYALWRNSKVKSEPTCLRSRSEYRPGVRWVRFNQNHDANRSAEWSRKRVAGFYGRLGGLEPLMAVSLLEGYFEGWYSGGNVAPLLSDIEASLDEGKSWGYVLDHDRWFDADGQPELCLDVRSAAYASLGWGSPLVMESADI